tara:strand:+ start:778 stop:1029 length:252 start_codon:yes stop_codon:yes gene_type:complete
LAGRSSVHILLPPNHVLHNKLLIQLLLLIGVKFASWRTSLNRILSLAAQLQLMCSNLILIERELHPSVLLRGHILKSKWHLII